MEVLMGVLFRVWWIHDGKSCIFGRVYYSYCKFLTHISSVGPCISRVTLRFRFRPVWKTHLYWGTGGSHEFCRNRILIEFRTSNRYSDSVESGGTGSSRKFQKFGFEPALRIRDSEKFEGSTALLQSTQAESGLMFFPTQTIVWKFRCLKFIVF